MRFITYLLVALLFSASMAATAQAAFVQDFSYGTGSLAGTTGTIIFELVPGASAQHAFAVVSNFINNAGTMGAVQERSGTSYGTLSGNPSDPDNLTFQSVPPTSRYLQTITFGSFLSFTLDICCSDSLFSLTLLDDRQVPVLSSNPNGHLLEVSGSSNCSTCTVNSTPTPVPAAAWLLVSGLLGLVGVRRRIAQ